MLILMSRFIGQAESIFGYLHGAVIEHPFTQWHHVTNVVDH
jgi:hypothetical protein